MPSAKFQAIWKIRKENLPIIIKGQLISKGLFDVIVSTKKPTEFFLKISALATKKRSDQKGISLIRGYLT